MSHEFKPYTDAPDYCVAELDSGDTCNRPREDHERAPEWALEMDAAIERASHD